MSRRGRLAGRIGGVMGTEEKPPPGLVERLRNESRGYDQWRVQDPQSGAYCIAFSWPETMLPERAAREWLADHKARFPGGLHSNYVVECVRVLPYRDRLLLEAADEIERAWAARDAAVAAERGRIGNELMKMHERDKARHNYWHCAAVELLGPNAPPTAAPQSPAP